MVDQTRLIIKALDGFVEDLITRLSLQATANLVEDTPVDTGWARSNWVPSIGQAVETTTGSPESVSASARSQGEAQVATSYRLPNNVFISNNVPYITRLNEGSSRQAPSGFVQSAIARAIREVTS